MLIGIFSGVAIGLILGLIIFFLWQKRRPNSNQILEEGAQKALASAVAEVVRTAREQLGAEKRDITETIGKDLKLHADNFKEITQALRREIETRQGEIRILEEDRNKKFGQISQALTDYKGLTEELRGSTEQLKKVLSSNQLRGSWGELQAEKILEAAGMREGTHYTKQTPIPGHADMRPDFTLFLPNQMQLHVEVKFPLQSLQLAMEAGEKAEQARHLAQFGMDLKLRMKEAGRYVAAGDNSVDYVILFVPSESVFEIINKNFASIIDSSFSQKIILVSPHSFFAVVRTIQESYTHFYYAENIKELLKYMQDLLTNFERFKGEFDDVGKALASASGKYAQIADTRYKQITKSTEKINSYQITQGEQPLLSSESEN